MPVATLEVPGTPKSLNQVGYRSHWAVGRREKLKWEEMLGVALMVAGVPRGLASVSASAEIHFKQRRRRDVGNHSALLDKALGDILQGGWGLPDDTPEFYSFGTVQLIAPKPEAKTIVRLDYKEG